MFVYLVRRAFQGIVVVLCVYTLVFFISRAVGDPATLVAPIGATRDQIEEIRQRMGLNRPVWEQYADSLGRAARGDLGSSMRYDEPVFPLIMRVLPNTLQLAVVAQLFALAVAIPAGVFAATRRNTFLDRLTVAGTVLGQSIPSFWLGLMLILVVGLYLHWLPISGTGDWRNLILPALTLSTYPMARTGRLMRSGMLEVLRQDYINLARAKGLTEVTLIRRHALKNALIPVVTIVSLDFGQALGGAVIIETIFAWPGLGRMIMTAINSRDFPLIQGAVLIVAAVIVVISLLVDLFYMYLDPRIKYW